MKKFNPVYFLATILYVCLAGGVINLAQDLSAKVFFFIIFVAPPFYIGLYNMDKDKKEE